MLNSFLQSYNPQMTGQDPQASHEVLGGRRYKTAAAAA